jgi:GT2 family glycosyltransferase
VRPLLIQLNEHCHESIDKVVLTINIPELDALAGLECRFPIKRIENVNAKGFGANQNQAFRNCVSPWFLVLNPDVGLDKDLLTPLISNAGPDTGLMAPRIYEPSKQQPEPHRSIITPMEIVARKRANYTPPAVPQWIPGLFMLFRSEAFSQIDGFDERYFMYGEDFDICARIRLANWKIQINEDLAIQHDAQRASHANIKHLYWHMSSLFKVWCSIAFWRYFIKSHSKNA